MSFLLEQKDLLTLKLHFVAKSAILFSPIWLFSCLVHSCREHYNPTPCSVWKHKKRKLMLCTACTRKSATLLSLLSVLVEGWRVLAISSSSQLESWLGLSLLNAVRRDGHADYPLMRKSLSLASVHNKHGGWFVSLITLKISLTPKADPKVALFTLSTQVTWIWDQPRKKPTTRWPGNAHVIEPILSWVWMIFKWDLG